MKKIHRFFITALPAEEDIVITEEHIVHQVFHVLRLKVGESLILFANNSNDVEYEIVTSSKKALSLKKIATHIVENPTRYLIAAVSIAKRDAFELMVQKLTEIGVREIIPLQSVHTVKQSVRKDRLELISTEALEQCGGTTKVVIHDAMTLAQCFEHTKGVDSVYFDTYTTSTHAPSSEKICMYIGPEGGWSADERKTFEEQGVYSMSLGNRILRTETAAIIGSHKLIWS